MDTSTSPGDRATNPAPQRQKRLTVSLKGERLARKVTLVFGFMSFIPLLVIFFFVFPHVRGSGAGDLLSWLLIGVIGSMFIGYFVLKHTVGSVMGVVHQARSIAQHYEGVGDEVGSGDEIAELARTFSRINQELHQKVEALESSRELIKRLLSRIGTAIVSYQGIDNLLQLIVENACVALDSELGNLMLVNGESQELEVKTAWSANGHTFPGQRMKLGEGIAGWVAKEKRAMRGTGPSATVGLPRSQSGDDAILCVPLTTREGTIGVLSVVRENARRPFSEDDEIMLANIGAQVAVAIENYRLNLDVERTYLETVMALALAVEAKDPYSAGHSKRVGFYSVRIAEAMGTDEETKRILKDAGLLHDVGKIGIKDVVLQKAEQLTPEEQHLMRQHPVIGEAIIKPLRSLGKVAEVVRYHHEAYNGSGYPSGLKGDQIPLAVRILTVADTYDAMVTDRPYRKRLSLQQATEELRRGAGTQFDPNVVDAFLKLLTEKAERLTTHHLDA